LIDIAENEFGLSHLAVPERVKDNIVQRMDELSPEEQASLVEEAVADPADCT
jgi:uncharacterized protein